MSGGKRILALVTDAYGGNGGIAAYARDTIAAMASDPRVEEVVVVPRLAGVDEEAIPADVRVERVAARGDLAYLSTIGRLLVTRRFDGIWVNHINLTPFAWVSARASRARMGLVLHGVEAWTPSRRRSVRFAAKQADLLLPVSSVTLGRFKSAYGLGERPVVVSPGSVDLDRFTPGPRPTALAQRVGVEGKRVITTLGRLDPAENDAKGFGRIIVALPRLIQRWPDLVYVIGGEGGARGDLERLAQTLGVAAHVRFAGLVDERDKPDFYRLSDAFAMPSVGEGLGIVFLESLACGVPTIASDRDGGREAVAGMGWTIDPEDPAALEGALAEAFVRPRARPEALDHFSSRRMAQRVREALDALLAEG